MLQAVHASREGSESTSTRVESTWPRCTVDAGRWTLNAGRRKGQSVQCRAGLASFPGSRASTAAVARVITSLEVDYAALD